MSVNHFKTSVSVTSPLELPTSLTLSERSYTSPPSLSPQPASVSLLSIPLHTRTSKSHGTAPVQSSQHSLPSTEGLRRCSTTTIQVVEVRKIFCASAMIHCFLVTKLSTVLASLSLTAHKI